MKTLFQNITETEFNKLFSNEEDCLKYLAEQKWAQGFKCRKCGHTNYCNGKSPYSRRCTRCKAEESATAHTIFHRCRFHLPDAFRLAYLVCHNPNISSYKLSEILKLRHMTCWKFKSRIMECIDNQDSFTEFQKANIKQKLKNK